MRLVFMADPKIRILHLYGKVPAMLVNNDKVVIPEDDLQPLIYKLNNVFRFKTDKLYSSVYFSAQELRQRCEQITVRAPEGTEMTVVVSQLHTEVICGVRLVTLVYGVLWLDVNSTVAMAGLSRPCSYEQQEFQAGWDVQQKE